jgi:hypothetical protein
MAHIGHEAAFHFVGGARFVHGGAMPLDVLERVVTDWSNRA